MKRPMSHSTVNHPVASALRRTASTGSARLRRSTAPARIRKNLSKDLVDAHRRLSNCKQGFQRTTWFYNLAKETSLRSSFSGCVYRKISAESSDGTSGKETIGFSRARDQRTDTERLESSLSSFGMRKENKLARHYQIDKNSLPVLKLWLPT